MIIVVLSCDKNKDLFEPFFYCMEKYWPNHPQIVYSTETIVNPFYATFNFDYDIEHWTDRVRKTLKRLKDDYVLLMVDDIFLQDYVDNDRINSLTKYFNKDIACINLEPSFDKNDILYRNDIMQRSENGKFKTSLMCGLWNRKKLIEVLDYSTNPWQFEWDNKHKDFIYLITDKGNYLNWGYKLNKDNTKWRFGLHEGKWFRETIKFLRKEGIEMNFTERGCLNLKKCFGILSYFPWEQPERKQRQDRLDKLIKQISDLWPDIPIMVIAQQWGKYNLEGKCKNQVIRFDYGKLGILGARQKLREHFLELDFDYLIMFDDDAIIEQDDPLLAKKYMEELDKHPDSFCFIKGNGSSPYTEYNDSQLNLCSISRYIYEKEPIPNIDPQKSEAFEDRIWSTLLHFKYANKEFDAPKGIRCIHFKNTNEPVPSTWAGEKSYSWKSMRSNTLEIEKYISENKELPKKWKK